MSSLIYDKIEVETCFFLGGGFGSYCCSRAKGWMHRQGIID